MDLVIILDASTSVTEANFKKQLEFVKTIVEYADIDSGKNIIILIQQIVDETNVLVEYNETYQELKVLSVLCILECLLVAWSVTHHS